MIKRLTIVAVLCAVVVLAGAHHALGEAPSSYVSPFTAEEIETGSGDSDSADTTPVVLPVQQQNTQNQGQGGSAGNTGGKNSDGWTWFMGAVSGSGSGTVQANESAPRILIDEPANAVQPTQPLIPWITTPQNQNKNQNENNKQDQYQHQGQQKGDQQKTQPPQIQIPAITLPWTAPAAPQVTEGTQVQHQNIIDIGSSLRQLKEEVKKIEEKVKEAVKSDVQKAKERAENTAPPLASDVEQDTVKKFDATIREKRIAELQSKLSNDVRSALAGGAINKETLDTLEPVLKSSLAEIEALIQAETGTKVDLSPSARRITDVVASNTEPLNQARKELVARHGLELYTDRDQDGVSDYDEKNIYGTDPLNAYTAGSSLTDGERILLGLDVKSTSNDLVPVESPRVAGPTVQDIFEVHSIAVNLTPLDGASSTETEGAAAVPAFKQEITFAGRGLPNSFVTLYVFSTPIVVTVKTDISGAWTYTLDSELEDGSHELYVATVDVAGKILAKSPAVPFVKRAEAAEFTPLLVPAIENPSPLDILKQNLLLVGIGAVLIFAFVAVLILGILRIVPRNEPPRAA